MTAITASSQCLPGFILNLRSVSGILGNGEDFIVDGGSLAKASAVAVSLRQVFQSAHFGHAVAGVLGGAAECERGAIDVVERQIGARNARLHRFIHPGVGFQELPVGGDSVRVAACPQ
jgi:hypothetical protein